VDVDGDGILAALSFCNALHIIEGLRVKVV
jgi:hypothetical protein